MGDDEPLDGWSASRVPTKFKSSMGCSAHFFVGFDNGDRSESLTATLSLNLGDLIQADG